MSEVGSMETGQSADKWDALRKAAEAATPGPWTHVAQRDNEGRSIIHLCEDEPGSAVMIAPHVIKMKDANFIREANPATILELLSELRSKEVMPNERIHNTAETPPMMALNGNGLDRATLSELRGMAVDTSQAPVEADPIRALVDEQAEDGGLWFVAETITEDYLQRALRKLHAAIEENPIRGMERGGEGIRRQALLDAREAVVAVANQYKPSGLGALKWNAADNCRIAINAPVGHPLSYRRSGWVD